MIPPRGFIGNLLFDSTVKIGDIFNLKGELQFSRLKGWYRIATYPLFKENERGGTIFVIEDITENKQMELMLIDSQHMADLGSLSAAINHELKSLLQVIMWSSEDLSDRLKRGPLKYEEGASRPGYYSKKLLADQ